eukprot:CAMPEP_0183715112 /NCGR_PEP_ID=MMETSP0737-20130205/9468_1 /TAXON_ID=385413 /ORGANISM="Thalassiosira miniscula, Strain CCMP1093" /LENGTH=348 /DNA_ID=CAMNT_0025944185 /DNA_START=49 /DNA_END=1095 /DNA_ORIENTATION=+
MTDNGTFPTTTSGNSASAISESDDYNNSKQLRRSDSSFYEQARSPSEIASSIQNDFSWALARDLVLSMALYAFGVHGPKPLILPLIGGLTTRPIPYQVTAAGDVLLDLELANDMIPKSEVTFPSAKLWFISLKLPLCIVIILGSIFPLILSKVPNNNSLHNTHAGVCTILVAIGISELVTQTFKFYVGRLRPNFYDLCGFDKHTLECTNGDEMEMEARMSFPSGHSSLSFSGLVCVVLFLLGRVKSNKATLKGKILTVLSYTPVLLAMWCATSRLVDNWHHPSDILAGSILGTISAYISYHIWFPRLSSTYAGIPLSVLQQMENDNTIGSDYMIVEKALSLPLYNSES